MEALLVIGGLWFLASPLAFLAVLVSGRVAAGRVEALERELSATMLGRDAIAQRLARVEAALASGVPALGPYRGHAETAAPVAVSAHARLREAWPSGSLPSDEAAHSARARTQRDSRGRAPRHP